MLNFLVSTIAHGLLSAHSPDNSPIKWAEFFILDQSSVLGSKTNKKFRLNSFIKIFTNLKSKFKCRDYRFLARYKHE